MIVGALMDIVIQIKDLLDGRYSVQLAKELLYFEP
jgi:hypothetical protein